MGRQKDRLFQIGLGLVFFNFLFDFLAFVSPSWLESIPEFHSSFTRLGLWVACFNNYIHPEDYVSKAYSGCWYIYYPEYYYIRSWLNPGWFYGVQMLSSVAFLCRCITLVIVVLMAGRNASKDYNKKPFKGVLTTLSITTLISIVVLILMGVKSKDREWMPRPDQNRLSWGFGMAVMAGFCSLFALMVFILIFLRGYWKDLQAKAARPPPPPTSAPGLPVSSVPPPGAYYAGQPRPYYSTQPPQQQAYLMKPQQQPRNTMPSSSARFPVERPGDTTV